MKHCPNCGSTAQFKISTPLYFENGVWKQQKKCGCGCVVVLRFTEEIDRIEYLELITRTAAEMIKTINEKAKK